MAPSSSLEEIDGLRALPIELIKLIRDPLGSLRVEELELTNIQVRIIGAALGRRSAQQKLAGRGTATCIRLV